MKKRLISFMAMLLCSLAVLAETFVVDGIRYNVTSATAPLTVEVISNNPKYSGDIVIPQKVEYNNEECSVTSIGFNAFSGCSGLTSITIPSSVTSIGNRAFSNCSGLTAIVVEAGNTVYDSRNNCNAIIKTETNELRAGCKNTVIPNTVTSIGGYAFYDCSGLTSIAIPSSVTSIGDYAFWFCSSLTAITIPSSVTSIGEYAFRFCSGLTSITIPSSVTSIGDWAFQDCSSLTSITIPSSVTSIGDGVFEGCRGLTSITIPSSVTSIGVRAFNSCSGLTSITIPSSVTSIGVRAFQYCSGLTSIVVEAGNTVYDSRNNCNAIIKAETNELIAGCQNTVIPSSVTSIGDWAFQDCSSLTSITIPSSVTSIGRSAFYDCSGLTSIDIPSSVTSIGEYAFYGCSSLTSINIPNSVTSIGIQAFSYCSGLSSITIPSSVTSIGSSAFRGCSSLTSITIPSSVTSIGSSAFYHCSGLTSVTVGAMTPIAIHESCFTNRENATLYVPHGSKAAYDDAESWKDFNKIEEMFTGTVTDGLGVKYTENNDFTCYVSGHEDSYDACIVIPNCFHGRIVSSIGGNAFEDCSSLTSISIPNSVTSIGSNAFSGCNNLTSVTVISETPVEVTNNVFSNRENATLYVPAGSVDDYQTADYWKDFNIEELFTGTVADEQGVRYTANSDGSCSVSGREDNLNASIVIPKIVQGRTVASIGAYAFSSCSGLTAITIPSSVTSIGDGAFSGCSSLTSIVVEAGNTVYDSRNNCNAIIKTSDNELIAGCQNTIIPSSVTSIGVQAFDGCSGLTSIAIPSSVTSIGAYAFSDCSGLTAITIGNSVTSIGVEAFQSCSGLTAIVVEAGNTVYDSRNNCNAIIKTSDNELIAGCQNTIIPNSVTSIGYEAFQSCSGLTAITIPNSVTSIGSFAFSDCI